MADSADIQEVHERSPETVDRIMVGACGAIWLVLLVVSVIATVALVELGRGHRSGGSGHSPWLLYSIIAVSAVVIAGAIPLLLRARRAAGMARPSEHGPAEAPSVPIRPIEARTEKLRVFGTSVDPYEKSRPEPLPSVSRVSTAVLDRLWLRGTVSLLGATGLALIGVAAGTYLLAQSSVTGAWIALGLAGAITLAMPAILIFFHRQVGEASGELAVGA